MADFEGVLEDELYSDGNYSIPSLNGFVGKGNDSVVVMGGGGVRREYYRPFLEKMMGKGYNAFCPQVLGVEAKYKDGMRGYRDVIASSKRIINDVMERTEGDVFLACDSIGCANGSYCLDLVDAAAMHGMTDMTAMMGTLPAHLRFLSGILFKSSGIFDVSMDPMGFIRTLADQQTKEFIDERIMKDDAQRQKYTTLVSTRAFHDVFDYSPLKGIAQGETPVIILDSEQDPLSAKIREKVKDMASRNSYLTYRMVPDSGHLWMSADPAACAEAMHEFFSSVRTAPKRSG
jgi:hypothetical protein